MTHEPLAPTTTSTGVSSYSSLEEAVARYRAVLSSTLDPIITIDDHGVILGASDSVWRVFGWTPAEMVGRNVTMIMPEPDRSLHDGYLAAYRDTGITGILGRTRELEAVRRDGTGVPILISVAKVDLPGKDQPLFTAVIHDITDRRQAEEQLRRFRTALDSSADCVYLIDRSSMRFIDVNQTACQSLGYTRQELLARRLEDIMEGVSREELARRLDAVLAGATDAGEIAAIHRCRDGSAYPIEVRLRPCHSDRGCGCLTAIARDVTQRRRDEASLHLLQDLALTAASAGDLNTAIRLTLEKICEATGWDYGEAWLPDATGRRLIEPPVWHTRLRSSRPPSPPAGIDGLAGRVWASRRPVWLADLNTDPELRARGPLRSPLNAGVGVPILSGVRVVAVMAFFMAESREEDSGQLHLVRAAVAPLGSIIERKKAEDELARHHEQLEELVAERTAELSATHAQLRMADRLASIGTLAAGLGHDMNNVLLPVRLHLDALDVASPSDSLARHIGAIRNSVDYLQHLTDGLHLLSLDPHADTAPVGRTDLAAWWNQVGPLLRSGVGSRATLKCHLPSGLPPVAVPPHQLTQALLNLVVNAGEVVREGGHIRVWATTIDGDHMVQVGVTDDGPGMTDEVRRRAMDPFFTTKTRGLGTGLGLSLVRSVAVSAGGSVHIDSTLGQGTTVTLTLPPAHDHALAAADDVEPPAAAVSITDERVAALVGAVLRAAGWSVRYDGSWTPGSESLWITEVTPAAQAQAERWQGEGRLVVVLGPPPADWTPPPLVISNPSDFAEIRDRIEEAASLMGPRETG